MDIYCRGGHIMSTRTSTVSRKFTVPAFLLLIVIMICGTTFPVSSQAATTKIRISTSGMKGSYTGRGYQVSLDQKRISNTSFPPVCVKKTWMIPADLISKRLNCQSAKFDSNGRTLTITDFTGQKQIVIKAGSNKMSVNGKKYSMTKPAVIAKNTRTGKSIMYVPAAYIASKLGYAYKVSGKKIHLTTLQLFYRTAKDSSYDTSKYSNALTTISLTRNSSNSRNILNLETAKETTQDNTSVAIDDNLGIISYTFQNTYNALEEGDLDISNKYIKKISLSVSGTNTVVQVQYDTRQRYDTSLTDQGAEIRFTSVYYSMQIPLPEGVSFSSVRTNDLYADNKFYFVIPGLCKDKINADLYYLDHEISSVSVKEDESAEETKVVVKTKDLQGYKMEEGDGYFRVIMGDPDDIYDNIVVLDAGHGDHDSGATNHGTKEKNLNLAMIYTHMKKYFPADQTHIKAYWTRSDDTFVELMDRAKYASKVSADMFVSLHMNSCGSAAVSGLEVYYSLSNNKVSPSKLTSKILARNMHDTLVADLNEPTRGVKTAQYVVCRYNTVPAILIELGFISGSSDYKKLTDPAYQKKASASIYKCIANTFKEYPSVR